MEITSNQIERVRRDWLTIAGEQIEVTFISGTFFAYGSELAMLRLLKAYRQNKSAHQSYSSNASKFYFSLDMPA